MTCCLYGIAVKCVIWTKSHEQIFHMDEKYGLSDFCLILHDGVQTLPSFYFSRVVYGHL